MRPTTFMTNIFIYFTLLPGSLLLLLLPCMLKAVLYLRHGNIAAAVASAGQFYRVITLHAESPMLCFWPYIHT